MGKLELEVKILDIDKEKFIKKLEKLGAKLKKKQNNTYTHMTYQQYMEDM